MHRFVLNLPDTAQRERSRAAARAFGADAAERIGRLLSRCPAHRPTPLVCLDGLAASLGLAGLRAKDERGRLGLGSFKALGGAYAVLALAAEAASRQEGRHVAIDELANARFAFRDALTVATATAGNHGRSVAAGASLAGARCVVFVCDGVPEDQIAAIARHGAEIRRVAGLYEAALDACRTAAAQHDWQVVCDTSWPGYEEVPASVMAGYTAMAAEAVAQSGPQAPTHVFLQAGVGGMAAAVVGHLGMRSRGRVPRFAVVEPSAAACLLESARTGAPTAIGHDRARTAMGRLECHAPSSLAWAVLGGLADAFVAVPDDTAFEAQRHLADFDITTSPSGAAGLAGLLAVSRNPQSRSALGLDHSSRVLVFVTEEAPLAERRRIAMPRFGNPVASCG